MSKKGTIRIDKEFGLNPTVMVCWWCGEDSGVAVGCDRKLARACGSKTGEMPRQVCLNMDPCPKCRERSKQGVVIAAVKDGIRREEIMTSRVPGYWLVRRAAVERMAEGCDASGAEQLRASLKRGFLVLEEGAARKFGLYDTADKEATA